jgi:PAS domain S-box-containing protein
VSGETRRKGVPIRADFPRQLEATPDAIVAFADDGEFLYWSRAAEVMFGFSRDEAVTLKTGAKQS